MTSPMAAGLSRLRDFLAFDRDSTGTLTRRTGPGVLNETTGIYTRPSSDIFTGKVSITEPNRTPTVAEYGHADVTVDILEIGFPVTVDVEPGDVFTVATSVFDPTLNGKDMVVVGVTSGSWLAKRTATAVRRDRLPDGEWARLVG